MLKRLNEVLLFAVALTGIAGCHVSPAPVYRSVPPPPPPVVRHQVHYGTPMYATGMMYVHDPVPPHPVHHRPPMIRPRPHPHPPSRGPAVGAPARHPRGAKPVIRSVAPKPAGRPAVKPGRPKPSDVKGVPAKAPKKPGGKNSGMPPKKTPAPKRM